MGVVGGAEVSRSGNKGPSERGKEELEGMLGREGERIMKRVW